MITNQRKNNIRVSAVAIIDNDNRVLLSKRLKHKFLGEMWEFPGGKIENNETPKEALIREIKEELGVDLCLECINFIEMIEHDYQDFSVELYFYLCRKWQGIILPKENQELTWVTKFKLANYLMPQANEKLICSLKEHLF